MTRHEIVQRYPRASESFIRANLSVDDSIPDAKQCERPKALARRDEGKAQRPRLLHCRFTLCRKSLLDVDAKYASVKDLLDCLVIAGIVDGDKEGQITLEVNQKKIIKGESETVIIEVFRPKRNPKINLAMRASFA